MTLRVIGAGFGRTGTLSLKAALERLGFAKCYHMLELLMNPQQVVYWEAAGEGRPVDWEALFAGYQAAVDYPACRYYRELMAQYPAAKVKHLSKGQRARTGLVLALAHRPELLVLDEPSSGLDPIVRRDILGAIIRTIADEGRTVLFSSHLLDEVERVSDRVAMIDHGRDIHGTAWGALQAVAAYVDHAQPMRRTANRTPAEARFERATEPAPLKDRALELLTQGGNQ